MGAVGLQTIRFPAYRLEKSKCWGASGDPRVTCTACHDPHEPIQREPAAYDSACLDCHAKTLQASADPNHPGDPNHSVDPGPKAKACPVATSKCVTCHMPKVDLPEMHYKCTDHNIRIVRIGDPFPD